MRKDAGKQMRKRTILFLAANPKNSPTLRLGEEVREIESGLMRAKKNHLYRLEQKWALRSRDLRQALLDSEPSIVHFSGHGSPKSGLALEDQSGRTKYIEPQALAGLFRLFSRHIECVLLNACYSEEQASSIAEYIDYVIGMSASIKDKTAIEFSIGFYDALAAGRSFEDAFHFGCNAICLEGLPDAETPKLIKRARIITNPVAILTSPGFSGLLESASLCRNIHVESWLIAIYFVLILRHLSPPYSKKKLSGLAEYLPIMHRCPHSLSEIIIESLNFLDFAFWENDCLYISNKYRLTEYVSASLSDAILSIRNIEPLRLVQFGQYWSIHISHHLHHNIHSCDSLLDLIERFIDIASRSSMGEPAFRNSEDILICLFSKVDIAKQIQVQAKAFESYCLPFHQALEISNYLHKGLLIWGWLIDFPDLSEALLLRLSNTDREWSSGFWLLALSFLAQRDERLYARIERSILEGVPLGIIPPAITEILRLSADLKDSTHTARAIAYSLGMLTPSGLSIKGYHELCKEQKWGRFAGFVEYDKTSSLRRDKE